MRARIVVASGSAFAPRQKHRGAAQTPACATLRATLRLMLYEMQENSTARISCATGPYNEKAAEMLPPLESAELPEPL
jgi:hypothetical protein